METDNTGAQDRGRGSAGAVADQAACASDGELRKGPQERKGGKREEVKERRGRHAGRA